MRDQVRVGLVGTSWWADQMYLRSLASHPQATIAAICGRNRERAEALAKKYEIPTVYTDYRQLLAHDHLDALIVATPDDLHYPVVMDGLDVGLHMLCEKPMALTLEQAQTMAARADAMRVKHMILFTFRALPQFRYLHSLVDEGYVGRNYHLRLGFLRGDARQANANWRYDAQRSLGVLGSLGSHMIDLAHWYAGDIVRVSAHLASHADRQAGQAQDRANDSAMLTVEFKSGAQGAIHVSSVANVGERALEQHVILHGEGGTLEFIRHGAGHEQGHIRGIRQDEKQFQTLPVPEHYVGEVDLHNWLDPFTKQPVGARLFVDAILNDFQPSSTFHDGVKVQEILEAAIESHRKGCWVAVN
ncbi:MAG: Gfo/Idh/MocA family oxidoreductase [Caldilineaceae bacterium]|nr:Gfo/Idh/MocA family oxidoreductase [Caldilineaceae bacterium]